MPSLSKCTWIELAFTLIYIHPYISVCRPSAIPGPIPDELVVPTTTSIGLLFYVILSFKPCALYMHFQMKVISWHHLSRCEIIDENGLAPRSFHQGCTCWIFIWYVFHSQYMETKAVSYSIYGTNLPHFTSSIFPHKFSHSHPKCSLSFGQNSWILPSWMVCHINCVESQFTNYL